MRIAEVKKLGIDTDNNSDFGIAIRNQKLSELATGLEALVLQKEAGPYSGKSLEWWRAALLEVGSELFTDDGEGGDLIELVERRTGVKFPTDEDQGWAIWRIAQDIADNVDDEKE